MATERAAPTRPTSARPHTWSWTNRWTNCMSPMATSTIGSSCSTRRQAPTSGTGARMAALRTTVISPERARSYRARSAVPFSMRTSRASTIPTDRRRRSSASCMPSACRTTASCTCATGPTIASRCSGRTARSCARDLSRGRRSGADRCGTSPSRAIRNSDTSSCRTAPTSRCGFCCARRCRCWGHSGGPATGPASSTARTISRRMRKETSSSPKPTRGSACRSSSTRGLAPRRARGARRQVNRGDQQPTARRARVPRRDRRSRTLR